MMKLRGSSTSHFIWTIHHGIVKRVHNTDSYGKPALKFKNLENIYQPTDAKYTSKFQDDYAGIEFNGGGVEIDYTSLPFAERKTQAGNCDAMEEDKPECPSYEDNLEVLTLSQFKKKCKRKKRKASESVLLTPKVEEDDSDLGEPLCKLRVKSPKSKKMPVNGSLSASSRSTALVSYDISGGADGSVLFNKDHATVTVKVEAPEVENFECRETTFLADDPLNCNEPMNFIASESGFIVESMKSGSFMNEGEIGLNEVSLDNLSEIKNTLIVPPMGEENMELVNEENISNVSLPLSVSEVDKECDNHNQPPLNASFMEDDSPVEDMMASTSDCTERHTYFQQAPKQVNYIPGAQDSDLTFHDDQPCMDLGQAPEQVNYIPGAQDSVSTFNDDQPCMDLGQVSDSCMVEECAESSATNQECGSPNVMPDYLCLPWKTHSWPSTGDDDAEAKSPISEEKQHLTSVNADSESISLTSDSESISLTSDNNSVVPEDTPILPEQPSIVPANADSEVTLSNHNNQIDITREASEIRNSNCIKLRHPERLPSTRKAISPTSQEKLCLAMKSAEFLDDMDRYKCKEKLYFEDQAENKFSSASLDVKDEPNVHPQQAIRLIQNKVVISPNHLRRSKHYKKANKCDAPKGCLDGPRLCRSLPRFSTGCTSIQKCSESAIAFSQRQMQDIETLASKLMNELNSMKAIVGEKINIEARDSTSLKNEADEVKSAIKSATKTEEAARKWLSMMTRDCNRFCKIMKLKEDSNTSAADLGIGSPNQEKPLQKERKKISFADEAGGTLCDVKFFQIDGASIEPLNSLGVVTIFEKLKEERLRWYEHAQRRLPSTPVLELFEDMTFDRNRL